MSEVTQSCPTLCDPMDCSPPGSCVHGILQERICSGLPFPPPGGLPHPGIKPVSPALAGGFFTAEPARKPPLQYRKCIQSNQMDGKPFLKISFKFV